ncbi:protein SLOW GREEN 1, chloroplastic [Andrographis paniculata]|uniref:protein SLOW GREEN 1, chloroplastic n=1 Tax=Andrographis paniculata TaxID=175694 RepID=UPI0021E98281|nr:protein SLOW GREEN 1, chloroplastic [Andrographis paniculata]
MAASSLSNLNFSLSSNHSINPTPKSARPRTLNPSKFPSILNYSSSSQSRPTLPPQPLNKRPFHTKSLTTLPLSSPPQAGIRKYFVEKIATVLLGSLIFAGTLKSRPVLAQPVEEKSERYKDEETSEEEVMCEKLLEQNPTDVGALKMAVNVKIKKGRIKEALGYAEKLIEQQPNEMEWRLLQALCYEMMGHLSKAKSLFKDILKQKPLLLRALHGLAMVMHKKHEGPAVFEMLERASDLARQQKKVNKERNIRILIAQMHLIKGDLESALEKFQALIDENPRDFRPYLCQGIIYSMLDKKRDADASFEIYQSLVPKEFPQRDFLDDVVLSAKKEPKQKLRKALQS